MLNFQSCMLSCKILMLTCHLLLCKNYILYSSEIIHVLEQEKKQQMILIYLYFLNEHILDKVYNLV